MSRKALVLFLLLGVIWGIPYLLIMIAVADYHPVIVAFGRAAIGALVLLPFVLRRGTLLAGFRRPGWLLFYTVMEISGPWFLIGYAETRVTSSMAGLIVALTPILGVIVAMGVMGERLDLRRLIGLCLGLLGVAALLGFDDAPLQPWAVVALVLSALGYACGPFIVSSKLTEADATAVVVASLILAALLYLPAVPFHWPARMSVDATLAVIVLAVLCTAVAFKLLFMLIAEVGATRATVIAYLNPAVAVLLGVAVLGEPLSPGLFGGFALIMAGSWLATQGRSPAKENPDALRPKAGA